MTTANTNNKPFTALHLFCGLGGGALGFKRAGFETLLGIDFNAAACEDFRRIVGAPALQADLTTMSPDELRAACGGRRPDVVFTSPPCKSYSSCTPLAVALSPKYQEMSSLSLRGVWLSLEAWSSSPPPLIVLENVPRILDKTRGGDRWIEQVCGLLRGYGYAVKTSTHDCGELGGLAQHRRRFLLVARHMEQVPEVLYHPPAKRVRGCGEVLGELPVPLPDLSNDGGPLHRLGKLCALNWVRLALIPPGKDWRALNAYHSVYSLPPSDSRQNGPYGVNDWDAASHTVIGNAKPGAAWACVNDPRLGSSPRNATMGVKGFDQASGTVLGAARWDNSASCVADPRIHSPKPRREGGDGVTAWGSPSTTVIAHGSHHNGPWQVADPRLAHSPRADSWGVLPWATPSHTIRGVEKYANGAASVADPRVPGPVVEGPVLDLHNVKKQIRLVIVAPDGTWHRPMTTLELAVLQGFPALDCNGGWMSLAGNNMELWRERIGNAVPPPAAEAVARQMLLTLEAARGGQLLLSSTRIWVSPTQQLSLM